MCQIDDLESAIEPFSETYARFPRLVKALSEFLNVAQKPCRGFVLVKKQWFANTIPLQNRCPLRQNKFHPPAAYPRIDLASLIQTDPNVFGSQGGCLWYTTNDIVDKF